MLLIATTASATATGNPASRERGPNPPKEVLEAALEEVTVTATRRREDARTLPAPIDAISGERLRALAPDVAAGALRGMAGVFFQQTTPGQGIPIVRGLKGSQLLHLVDGIRVNNAFFRDAPNQYLGLIDPLALDRIEVLRGAAGSLYGADAMGGVVQFLTREVRFDGPSRQARGRLYASVDSADDGWLVRAEGATGNAQGSLAGGISWQERGDRRTGAGETIRPSGFEAQSGDLKVIWAPGPRTEWMAQVQQLEQPATPRVDELVPGFGQDQPASAQYRFEPNRRSLIQGRFRLAGAGQGFDQLEVNLARQVIVDDRVTQDFGSPRINREQNDSTLDGLTLRLDQQPGAQLDLSWGLESYRDEVRSARQLERADGDAGTSVRPRFPDRSTLDSDAVFLHARWRPDGRWSAQGGLRYSRFSIRLPETDSSPTVLLDPDDVTGDVGLRFALTDRLALVTNLGRGFRPPNVFDLGTLGPRPGNRFNIANPALGPEEVRSGDLGLKWTGQRWRADLFLFQLDYRDRITSVATGAITPDGRVVVRSENRAQVDIEGIEFSLQGQLNEATTLTGSVNWTRGEESTESGTRVPADRIPPLNGRLGLNWTPSERWTLTPFVLWADRQDRLSPRDVQDPRIDPTGTAGWFTLNLHASWRLSDQLALGLRLENLLDEAYREHGSGLDGRGRNFGAWVDMSF